MDFPFQQIKSAIRFADLGINTGQPQKQVVAVDRVFSDRQEFNSVLSFLEGLLFASRLGVNLAENNQSFRVFGLLLQFRRDALAGGQKRGVRSGLITKAAGNDCLLPFMRSEESIVIRLRSDASSQYLFGSVIVALLQRQIGLGDDDIVWIGRFSGFTDDDLFPTAEIGPGREINKCAKVPEIEIERLPSESAVQHFRIIGVTSQNKIIRSAQL